MRRSTKAEEAWSVPARAGDRGGRRGQARIDPALPTEAIGLHLDLYDPSLPLAAQLRTHIAAAGVVMTAIEDAHAVLQKQGVFDEPTITVVFVTPGSVNSALEPLRIARKLDRYRETARMALEPWIVEAALERLGSRRLSVEEQETVFNATRTPWKVRWPAWWSVLAAKCAGPK